MKLPALLVLLAAASAAASESDRERARALVDVGNERMAAADFDAAVRAYSEAYEAFPSVKILYNLAEARNGQHDVPGAIDAYERFLAGGGAEPGSELEGRVRNELDRLALSCAWLEFFGDLEDVVVEVSGRAVDPARRVCAPSGTTPVEARRGDEQKFLTVDVGLGETVRVEIAFGVPRPEEEGGPGWWLWAVIGVAAVGAGVGIAVAASASADPASGELGSTDTRDWTRP
ncbi:MAG: tetratricopeptide repeat protein [Deltaproteobacteria bacterium]|nr:tetratricopeptide repeat protein [Deltaproteobacteria bacterium]